MRKKFIKSILIVFVLITQLSLLKAQTQEIDLSGQWGFQTDLMDFRRGSLDIRYMHRLQESILLPGITDDYKIGYKSPYRHIDRLTRVYEYMGPAWYQREITIPKEWKGKRIFISFERVHWLSSIYVDTKEVSEIDYISVPHNHELTDFVKPGTVGIEDEGFDLVVEIGQRPVELLRIFVGAVPERLENITLLLLQLVLRLTLLQRERSHGQQSRHDDDHDRRIDDDISVAVGIVHPALFLAGPILRKCRRGSLADRAGIGCGVAFVDMSANAAYEFFLCHISPILPI